MTHAEVNIPLLRKAVEWAEAEAAKPREIREWEQQYFSLEATSPIESQIRESLGKSADCGTCYCIAGWVTQSIDADPEDDPAEAAAEALGISPDWMNEDEHLFAASNTIEDVRRIAEEIAGERL